MPSELRHILFRPAEVILAVRDYLKRSADPLPSGIVTTCTIGEEDKKLGIHLRLSIRPDSNVAFLRPEQTASSEHEIVVEAAMLTAALISHCARVGVPLPTSAGKSLQLFGAQLGLVLATRAKNDRLDVEGMRI